MSYGSSKWLPWVKDEEESLELIKMSYDAGINFIDTANAYSNGLSEQVVGKAIKKFNLPRSRLVIATKVHFPVHDDISIQPFGLPLDDPRLVNNGGLSRKAILQAVDDSLRRLDLDYIDLLYIHGFDEVSSINNCKGNCTHICLFLLLGNIYGRNYGGFT
jgi:aryl-alcohol dehydrogenase-like predicted oxidoreductase